MADARRDPDTGDDTDLGRPDPGSLAGTPRWVKVFGVIALLVVALLVVLVLAGKGGEHGPTRHGPSGEPGGQTPSSQVAEPGDAGARAGPPPGFEHGDQQP